MARAGTKCCFFTPFVDLEVLSGSKMGMCIIKEHFLEIHGIPYFFEQSTLLVMLILKKSVSLVSLVSTVSFWPATVYSCDNDGRLGRAKW